MLLIYMPFWLLMILLGAGCIFIGLWMVLRFR